MVTTILAYGTQALAKAGAIMKRMQSTETLGSTSAINSDKTGTLTLNQMTAVAMAVVGRRYAIEGRGYSTDGQITRVAGQTEIPLDQFLMPMVLALILSTVFGPFEALLKTTSLDLPQWLICTAVALSVIVASEIRKAIRRRRASEVVPAGPPVPPPAAAVS